MSSTNPNEKARTSRNKWEKYWKEKLGIKGYFDIQIQSVELSPCEHSGKKAGF
jgi:hypothetical protein